MERTIMNSLISWKNRTIRKPLILRGARQVGKTYILQEFADKYFKNNHYVNFEDDKNLSDIFTGNLVPERIITELEYYFGGTIDVKNDLLIFDEIQNCPRALTSLKYFNEKMPKSAICAAGSLLGISLIPEPFPVGKVTFLDMYPLSYYEFLLALGQNQLIKLLDSFDFTNPFPEIAHQKLWEYWKIYLITGGMPEVVKTYIENSDNQFTAVKTVRHLQKDLVDTYMFDIAKHSGKVNAANIERLWRNIPIQLGQSQNGNATKFRFKNVIPGVKGYERLAGPLKWLEAANLVNRVSLINRADIPLSSFSKENRFKLYFFDTGLLGAMSQIAPEILLKYNFGSYKGYFVENFAAQELKNYSEKNLYAWEGRTSEIEFLIESDSGIIPIEIKSGWVTHSKSLKVYKERYNPKLSIVVSAKNFRISGDLIYLPLYIINKIFGLK